MEISKNKEQEKKNVDDSMKTVTEKHENKQPDSSGECMLPPPAIVGFKKPMLFGPRPGLKKPRKKNVLDIEDSKEVTIKVDVTKKEEKNADNLKSSTTSKDPPNKSVESKISAAELLKQQKTPIAYKEPSWSGLCSDNYSFEVLKSGTIVDTVDLTNKPFYVFGRLPSCDITLEHPSLSRYHAVLQYCAVNTEKHEVGWYLYDLDSTHGTWANKAKLNPQTYYRIRVGHVVKFGGSSRLHILQGPDEDQEDEAELSITEMKQLREKQEKELEVIHQADTEMSALTSTTEVDTGCSWGMGEDAADVETENPFAEVTVDEDLYIDDPKKALRGFFEREGYDLPEYEVVENGKGKYKCTVELPLDTPTGKAIIAEAIVDGKKKEAVVQCSLEACRILDRHGVLRQAKHESRKKKKKNWEDDDFYDSDDDTFLDRTGNIEKKRKRRMKQAGKTEKEIHTYESLTSKLAEIEHELKDIEEKLNKAKAASCESEDLDDIDAYVSSIKSGEAMDGKSRMKMKRQIFDLKQEKQKVEKLLMLAKPSINLPELKKSERQEDKHSQASNKSAPVFGKRILAPVRKPVVGPTLPVVSSSTGDSEEEEEEEDVNNQTSCEKVKQVSMETEMTPTETMKEVKPKEEKNVTETVDKTKQISERKQAPLLQDKLSVDTAVSTSEPIKRSPESPKVKPKKMKVKKLSKEYNDTDPDYSMWMPPKDQSGDGTTSLNAKFGY